MARTTIDQLIVNSPYEEPAEHWQYDRATRSFDRAVGRRPAGYVVASPDSRAFDDPGVFVEIPLVNQIRPRVKAWREAGYPGVTGVTKRLLKYWTDPEEFDSRRFFFCQIEAAETLIWLTEAPAAEKVGVEIPSDGGAFRRLCAKMATGFSRPAKPEEPLPDLVLNGYYLLGYDWRETAKDWSNRGFRTSPVMITVANRTETAARIKYAFDHRRVRIDELCNPERTLHIDSKVLEAAEAAAESMPGIDGNNGSEHSTRLTQKQRAELLRRQVDSVGRLGKEGERIQNVISVGMLSEGWDAKTVTHIMGLRAFTSQLLCEQVVGRGLRRTSYDVDPDNGLFKFKPEYVNIFGVPFTFLPHEGGMDGPPPPPQPKTAIEPVAEGRRISRSPGRT